MQTGAATHARAAAGRRHPAAAGQDARAGARAPARTQGAVAAVYYLSTTNKYYLV